MVLKAKSSSFLIVGSNLKGASDCHSSPQKLSLFPGSVNFFCTHLPLRPKHCNSDTKSSRGFTEKQKKTGNHNAMYGAHCDIPKEIIKH